MFCDMDCWSCEDKKCKFYKSKKELFIEVKDYKSRCEDALKELNKLDFDNFVYGKTALKNIKRSLQNILNGK